MVIQANAGRLPLADKSVDLIVTSPPYFGQRDYKDGEESLAGQIGNEPHPQEFLDALWSFTAEWWRVLKDEGSCFVNLGDKRAGSGSPGTTTQLVPPDARVTRVQYERVGTKAAYPKEGFGRDKSKQLIPQRYAIGCLDGLADPEGIGWVVRQEMIWAKLNGLPESVRDRVRDSHEPFWHLTKEEQYYSAVDEIREPHRSEPGRRGGKALAGQRAIKELGPNSGAYNPLGALPGSVWPIASEPLSIPEHLGIDHFAAFPSEWPRLLILGWSPPAICLECGKGRWPVLSVQQEQLRPGDEAGRAALNGDAAHGADRRAGTHVRNRSEIIGYACSCTPFTQHAGSGAPSPTAGPDGRQGDRPSDIEARHERVGPWREYHLAGWAAPPSRPAVILDPFGGTGTTAMVARALGRLGISVDLSASYGRLARWRIWESGGGAKTVGRTNRDRQGTLL